MSQTESTGEAVEDIVVESIDVSRTAFDDDSRLDEDPLALESIDVLDIAQALDAELGVHASANDLEALETVGELKHFVESRLDR